MKLLSRFDEGLARGEGAIATAFLLSMILAAAAQALLRNLSDAGIPGAAGALTYLPWVDTFLQKGTLWLAFLGASMATREGRHIGIDLAPRLLPPRAGLVVKSLTAAFAAAVSFLLARAFYAAVLVNAEEMAAYELYGASGDLLHACDATAADLAAAHSSAPGLFCGVRSGLSLLGVPVGTPEAALELIVPVMFVIIAARLAANAVQSALAAAGVVEPPPTVHEAPVGVPETSTDDGEA